MWRNSFTPMWRNSFTPIWRNSFVLPLRGQLFRDETCACCTRVLRSSRSVARCLKHRIRQVAVTDALTQRKALSAMVAWALASQATTPSPLPCAAMAHNGAARRVLRGIVFDMDGTLTVPCIDFAEMRRRVGVTTGDILHEIDNWSAERQETAHKILVEIETEANVNMKVMPGALEICAALDNKKIRRGLITRNVKSSVDYFHVRFQIDVFSPALSREFRPYKPSPAPLLHICSMWGLDPKEVMMVGDSAKDDIVCGNRAGALTCLLDDTDRYDLDTLPGEQQPTFKIKELSHLATILEENFDLVP